MNRRPRVLHLLSQRPSHTGSGISLSAIIKLAANAGWDQRVIVGVPPDDPHPNIAGLPDEHIHPLVFERGELDFPIPGMSDVMPYRSSRWSALSEEQLETYRRAWCQHVGEVVHTFEPHVIHARHIWLLSSMVKDIAPHVPVANHCHATGLRQMALCPHLAEEVQLGCARNERYCVLHEDHADALVDKLSVSPERIHIVGAGYRADLFHAKDRTIPERPSLVYVGKYSHAKGLPQLLDAFDRLQTTHPDLTLHIAGDGAGNEAEALRARMAAMAPRVTMHGQLKQDQLADLLRKSSVFVLPSFYEGLPLVLVEALACGCRLVCTDLPGVRSGFGSHLDEVMERVPMPRLIGPDVPAEDDIPVFVDRLHNAIDRALKAPVLPDPQTAMPHVLQPFTWEAVYHRIEGIWRDLMKLRQK